MPMSNTKREDIIQKALKVNTIEGVEDVLSEYYIYKLGFEDKELPREQKKIVSGRILLVANELGYIEDSLLADTSEEWTLRVIENLLNIIDKSTEKEV